MTAAAVRVKGGSFFWVPIVGVEIHAQINSTSKLFSGASNSSKSVTNSCFDLFDVSIPGSLPRVNEYCVRSAVKTAIALGLNLNKMSVFDRKHYFYADLPAGYQITQQRIPLASGSTSLHQLVETFEVSEATLNCVAGGSLLYPIYNPDSRSESRMIPQVARFDRLQIEHDSAKTVTLDDTVLVDMNRCGAPLMEIVSQPDFQFGYQVTDRPNLLND